MLNVQVFEYADAKVPPTLFDAFAVKNNDHTGMFRDDDVHVTDSPDAPHYIPLGAWTHVAATFDHGKIALFIGGKLVAWKATDIEHTSQVVYNDARFEDLMIGGILHHARNYVWQGAIDEVRVYSRALSEVEVGCLAR